MKNYCLATWDVDAYREQGIKRPVCWAFMSIGTEEELIPVGDLLDLPLYPWMQRGMFALYLDVTPLSPNYRQEVLGKRWELEQLGMTWEWSADLIVGAPRDSTDSTKQNTFATEEEFLQSMIRPIDIKDEWIEKAKKQTQPPVINDYQPRSVDLPDGDWSRPYVPPTIPSLH